MQVMDRPEKRTKRRLDAHFSISCRIAGSLDHKFHKGRAANVGSGGLYFETSADVFKPGELLSLELTLPPTPGLLEFGGKIAGFAKILRVERINDNALGDNSTCYLFGVAVQFCRPLRLCQ